MKSPSGFKTILVLLLAVFSILLVCVAISRMLFPMDLGNFESVVWTPAQIAASGSNPYAYADVEPYVMSPYGYFYYLIVGIGINLFGDQFWFARFLSVLSTFLICIIIVKLSRVFATDIILTAIALIIFLSSVPFLSMYALQRPDLLALLFSITGFSIVIHIFNRKNPEIDQLNYGLPLIFKVVLASFLCFGTLFFKQTFIMTAMFAGLWIALQREYFASILFFATGFVIIGITAFLLNYTSDGGYIWQHFELTKQIPISYLQSLIVTKAVLMSLTALIGLVVVIIEQGKFFSKSHLLKSQHLFFLAYFLCTAAIGFIVSSRAGSSVNHYLEAIFALSVLFLVLVKISSPLISQFLLIIFLLSGIFQLIRNTRGEYLRWRSYPYYAEIIQTLDENTPKDSVCISSFADLAIASGRKYHFGDWIQYTDGRSPSLKELFVEQIKSGKYKAVIWHSPSDELLLSSGYKMIPMKIAPPTNENYPVYLYLLKK